MRTMMLPVAATAALACLAVLYAGGASAGEALVTARAVSDLKAVFGRIESRDTVPARVRTGGTLLSRSVEEGSPVSAGDVIAVVGDEKLGLQLQAVDARLKALSAQLDNAKMELERAQSLLSRGAVTQSRLDQLRTAADVLANQIEATRAERAVVVQQTTEGQVLAPKSGRVLSVPAVPGSVVLPGETVARIAAGGYFLRIALPERHASTVKVGNTVSVGARGLSADADLPSARREGRIVKVYPELDGGRVVADVDVDGLGDYFVGERVAVWVAVAERQALTVPASAVSTRNGLDLVRVVTGSGTAQEVAVVLGPPVDAKAGEVEVLSGLRAGDRVVTP